MLRITDQYFWNFVFLVFFGGLVFTATIVLETEARVAYQDLTGWEFFILSLAVFRFTRLFVCDTVTKFFREQFWDAREMKGKILLIKPDSGPRRTIADLMSCPWCFGVWSAFVISFFYLLTPYAQFPVFILALGGAGTLLQQLAQLVGHKAERAKKETEFFS